MGHNQPGEPVEDLVRRRQFLTQLIFLNPRTAVMAAGLQRLRAPGLFLV